MMDIEARLGEILAQQARLEEQVKAAFKRIDEQKQLAESVHSLALSIERLTSAQKNMDSKLTALSSDVEEMKERPAKNWHNAVWLAITAVIGAVVGYLLKGVGLG